TTGKRVLLTHYLTEPEAPPEHPLTLGSWSTRHGVACAAGSAVLAILPAPARRFTAMVGVDAGAHVHPAHGEVVFSLVASGKVLTRTPVLDIQTPPRPVTAQLNGARAL